MRAFSLVMVLAATAVAAPAGALVAAPPLAASTELPQLAEARATLAALAAIRDDPRADAAYRFARSLGGQDARAADAPSLDARMYLEALAPGVDLLALDAIPRDAYDALGRVLAAHALAADAVARGAPLVEKEAVRALLIERVTAFAPLAADLRADEAPVEVCGALYLYFGEAPQTLTCEHVVSIAGHGSDLYLNRAGGAAMAEARLAIDLGGDDRYLANRTAVGGLNGGALWGSGALVDLGGDDVYDAAAVRWHDPPGSLPPEWQGVEGAVNGGAGRHGVGLLLDLAGSDRYRARVGYGSANGGASFGGSGALIDLGGVDETFVGRVDGLSGGVNGGANDGQGLFFHCGSGANLYEGYVQERGGVNGGGEQAVATFVSCGGDGSVLTGHARGGGVNGGGSGQAHTRAVWLEGDATFSGEVDHGGVNGGAYLSTALLLVGAGDQGFDAFIDQGPGGANGGAVEGVGALIDLGGNDVRSARGEGTAGGNGGGIAGGFGLLLDLGGDDLYVADIGGMPTPQLTSLSEMLQGAAVNGEGGIAGCGLLLDIGGRDEYVDIRRNQFASDETSLRGCGGRVDRPSI